MGRLLLAAVAASWVGCSLLLSPDDLSSAYGDGGPDAPATKADAALEADASDAYDGEAEAGSDADVGPGDGACADTMADPNNCGACGHGCLGGGCDGGACEPVQLLTGIDFHGLAVSGASAYVMEGMEGEIVKLSLDGGAVSKVISGIVRGHGLAVDGAGNYVYWTTQANAPSFIAGGAWRAKLSTDSGTEFDVLYDALGQPANAAGIAVDSHNVYYTQYDDGLVYQQTLQNITTALPTLVVFKGDAGAVSGASAQGVASNGVTLYWTDRAAGQVFATSEDGGAFNDGGLNQSALVPLALGQGYPGFPAVDSTYVYWSNQGTGPSGTIVRSPIGGCDAGSGDAGCMTTLASGQLRPLAVAVDGKAVYWTNQGDTAGNGAAVMRLALPP
jgi:hypothetical protein